jgi:hypothetical protein
MKARFVRAMSSARAARNHVSPVFDCLEGRQLLSGYTGFSHVRNILAPSGFYRVQLTGGGVLKSMPARGGSVNLSLLGTTPESTLTITQVRPRLHLPAENLEINSLSIKSGQMGSIHAGPATLDGVMSPLAGSLSTLEFGTLGPNSQVDIGGSVGSIIVGAVALGPGGHVVIAGDLSGSSGSGAMTVGSMVIDGGQFVIGRDAVAPISIVGDMRLSHNGLFAVGRDQLGTFSVGGSILLDKGGVLEFGRNVSGITVDGNLVVDPSGGGIGVGGELGNLTIQGIFRGQGSPTGIDLGVGLSLDQFTVNGGTTDQGSVQFANINVGKNIQNMTIAHGIFDSWITAGVAINNVTVGADGVVAIDNSEIDAGTSMTNVTLNGDVKSGYPTGDTTGYPTRIIAGKTRNGVFTANGTIGVSPSNTPQLGASPNFIINGTLIDAVIAASVAPYGDYPYLTTGNPAPYSIQPPANANSYTYPQPAGVTTLSDGTQVLNSSLRNYDVATNQNLGDTQYGALTGPLHTAVLANGAVNVTVTGGVVSSPHSSNEDYAGIFAVNTQGVSGNPLNP